MKKLHKSTKILLFEIAVLAMVTALFFAGLPYPMIFPYPWHKVLHIFGAVIFLGNIIVTAAWTIFAEQSGNREFLRSAPRVVNWADVWFTAPGVILLMGNGLIMSSRWGGLFHDSWLKIGFSLFAVSGIIWILFLIPAQEKMIRLGEAEGDLSDLFYRTLHWWYFWGILATIVPIATLVFMVVKPGL